MQGGGGATALLAQMQARGHRVPASRSCVPISSAPRSPLSFSPHRDGGKETWEVPVGASHKILVEWGAEFDNFDPVTQVWGGTAGCDALAP